MISDRTLQTVFGMRPRTVALWGAVIRGISVVVAGAVLSVLVTTYVHSVQNTIAVRHLQDFGLFYESAKQARSGGDMYDVTQLPGDVDTRPYWNMNPPHFHLLILPFTFLSPPTAFLAWLLLSAATLLVSLVLICRALQLRATGIAVLSVLVVVSAPMMLTLMTGQIGLILLLPFTLAWHCARQGRYARAGAWIGVCASIKPFFLLFVVYLVLLRRLRAAQMACLTLLGMFATGLTLFGLEAHRAWINHLSSVSWAEHYVNASVLGFVERTFSISEWQQVPIVNWPQVVGPVWLLAGGGICVATLWRVRHVADLDRQFLLTATASLLVSPVGWVYYAWFLMPPLAAGLTSRENPMPAWRVGLFGLGIASLLVPPPVPSMAVQWGHGLWTATLGSVYFWGLFALWIVAWIQLPQASVTFKRAPQEDENSRSGSANLAKPVTTRTSS